MQLVDGWSLFLCGKWQCKEEGGTLAGLRLDPDAPAVPFHDAFADGQPDTRAGIILALVQTLEDDEDALEILRVDTNTVIADREDPVGCLFFDTYMNFRFLLAMKLDGIADQVLEERFQLRIIPHHHWQRVIGQFGLALYERDLQVLEDIPQDFPAIDAFQIPCRACPRVSKPTGR